MHPATWLDGFTDWLFVLIRDGGLWVSGAGLGERGNGAPETAKVAIVMIAVLAVAELVGLHPRIKPARGMLHRLLQALWLTAFPARVGGRHALRGAKAGAAKVREVNARRRERRIQRMAERAAEEARRAAERKAREQLAMEELEREMSIAEEAAQHIPERAEISDKIEGDTQEAADKRAAARALTQARRKQEGTDTRVTRRVMAELSPILNRMAEALGVTAETPPKPSGPSLDREGVAKYESGTVASTAAPEPSDGVPAPVADYASTPPPVPEEAKPQRKSGRTKPGPFGDDGFGGGGFAS